MQHQPLKRQLQLLAKLRHWRYAAIYRARNTLGRNGDV